MDQRERINDSNEALLAAMDGRQAQVWTALPATIQSYNPQKMTCEAQPTIQARVRDKDGNMSWVNLPVLVDVPVIFPGGGGFTLTFPVAAGDEALIIFSSRCIDAWWQNGGVREQLELRMHDLSDGFAIVGPRSQPNVLAKKGTPPSASTVQLRSDDGQMYIEMAGGNVVNIKVPGGLNITGDVKVTGKVTATGEGTFNGGHTVSAHVHGGVTAGGANTNTPTG